MKYFCAILSLIAVLSSTPAYGDNANVLTNPGFESSPSGNWAARSCSFARTSSQKHSGSYSGRATSRTATWQGIQQDVTSKMISGQTYQVSGWVRTSGTASYPVMISFEQRDGSGTNYYSPATGVADSNGWVYLSGSFTLNVTAPLGVLYVYVEGPPSGVDIYFDDANVFGQVPAPPATNATGDVNFAKIYQKLEGFGGAGGWCDDTLVPLGLSHPEIYNILFGDLGLDIYRVRNTYQIDSGYMTRTATIVSNATASLGHPPRIMISSWSPPAYLKSTGSTVGGTLAKDGGGNYRYTEFAQWWRDSLAAWSSAGVNAYYISMQNEPDFIATWDTCQWLPTENPGYAGYKQGFTALYTNLNSMPNRPKLLVAEGANIPATTARINALDATDKSNAYGWAHHLYDGDAELPDNFISQMAAFNTQYGDRPLMQTEFYGGKTTWTNAMNLAKLLHNSMTIEKTSAYVYWDLFWTSGGGLVSISSSSYTINPPYYAFKHFSKFTDPNWYRIDVNTNSSNLRVSAYNDPCEPNASIVIINTSTDTDANLTLSLKNGFNPGNSGIYQSTSNVYFAYIGTFSTSTPVLLPKQSITTIHLAGFGDCNSVQAGDYRLDSDLNGDCYVDYEDLAIIAYYWLHTDCIAPGNCQGADFAPTDGVVDFFDFSDFAVQWRQCNNPQDAGCTPNW